MSLISIFEELLGSPLIREELLSEFSLSSWLVYSSTFNIKKGQVQQIIAYEV